MYGKVYNFWIYSPLIPGKLLTKKGGYDIINSNNITKRNQLTAEARRFLCAFLGQNERYRPRSYL